jgi:hypothetical protein
MFTIVHIATNLCRTSLLPRRLFGVILQSWDRRAATVLLKLNGHITNCLERAANAEQRALQATDPVMRSDNELLAASWRHLARSYQFVESLERFLSENARSKDDGGHREEIPPPEMLDVLNESPAQPATKPIIRRPRVKHATSFKDRLLKSAQDARAQAAGLPPGAARERLLLKARQSETAADIDTWISSPGSPPPDSLDPTRKPRV